MYLPTASPRVKALLSVLSIWNPLKERREGKAVEIRGEGTTLRFILSKSQKGNGAGVGGRTVRGKSRQAETVRQKAMVVTILLTCFKVHCITHHWFFM